MISWPVPARGRRTSLCKSFLPVLVRLSSTLPQRGKVLVFLALMLLRVFLMGLHWLWSV